MRWNWTKTFLIQAVAFGAVGGLVGLVGLASGKPENGLAVAIWFLVLVIPGAVIADAVSAWRARRARQSPPQRV